MEQDSGENGSKENQKPSVTPRASNGRTGNPLGSGMAMKIPKQPNKYVAVPKKGRQAKTPKDNAPDIPNVQSQTSREGRRAPKDERLSPPSNQRQTNGSRHSSASPTQRKGSGDACDERLSIVSSLPIFLDSSKLEGEVKTTPTVDMNDIEASSQSLKQLLSIGGKTSSRIVYSRIQLLNISENPSSKNRPDCLEANFNATNGRWDPETWHRSLSSPPPTSTSTEKPPKFPVSENRDRFTEDATSSGIILGPQRRSFQDGCHVTNTSSSRSSKIQTPNTTETTTSRHTRPRLLIRQRSEITEYEGPPAGRDRQIESASALRTEEFDWDRRGESKSRYGERDLSDLRPEPRRPRDLPKNLHELRSGNVRERDNEREFKDYRDRDYRERKFSHSRDYGNERGGWYQPQQRERREHRFSNNEPEPEWYTDGPTSQLDTIDLAGFTEETPAAATDFSSWGGGIPMDDTEDPNEGKKENEERERETDAEREKQEPLEKVDSGTIEADEKEQTKQEDTETAQPNIDEGNDFEIPAFAAIMAEILKEDSIQPTDDNGSLGLSSKFSHWFQQESNFKKDSDSGVSTPHEELEKIVELTAEQGLASPTDLDGKQQVGGKADFLRYLTQLKASAGNLSPSLKLDPSEQQEILRQQMKLGSVMTAADLETSVGARQSPSQSYGGVDAQSTEAFNKLVASIREKDKFRQQQQLFAQQAILQGKVPADLMASLTGGRTPSPDELAVHNMFQQSLIKKQLDMQKVAYKEKVRLMEQQRREEQLREAIRTADAKMHESKQMNKSLSFMPTSVMRKMQESRDEMNPGEADDLASATASFSAKLANSRKRPTDQMPHQSNDLLARIYQSASQPKRHDASNGLRRNASYPEELMEANKLNRGSAFHQPSRQNMGVHGLDLNVRGDVDATRFRLQELHAAGLLNRQHSKSDAFNNNLLKSEAMNHERSSPRDLTDKAPDVEMELKNQHEVAALTQSVLKQFNITEDGLSRLTPQEQHNVVQVIQRQYLEMQAQKQLHKKLSQNAMHSQNELQNAGKQHNASLLKPVIPPNSLGIKFPPQPGIPGVTAPGPIPGMLPSTNPALHPYHLRQLQPLSFLQPMTRSPVVPTAFLPHQPHLSGRIFPSNVPLAPPIANPAAAIMQMQFLQHQQQQQQQRLYAAAIQQQQIQQAFAAARQKDPREFSNPLERWFTRDMLSQSQLPPHKPLNLADVERLDQPNKE